MDIANNQIDQLWALYLPLGQICVFFGRFTQIVCPASYIFQGALVKGVLYHFDSPLMLKCGFKPSQEHTAIRLVQT